jgi:hypothetical protein
MSDARAVATPGATEEAHSAAYASWAEQSAYGIDDQLCDL